MWKSLVLVFDGKVDLGKRFVPDELQSLGQRDSVVVAAVRMASRAEIVVVSGSDGRTETQICASDITQKRHEVTSR